MNRGSRKHVLDWVSQPRFLPELLQLAQPVDCHVTSSSTWKPIDSKNKGEARLDQFGPMSMPDHPAWPLMTSWWLAHTNGANTPNWDIALSCNVEGQPGLILVEAKANVPELGVAGKVRDPKATENSEANRDRIGIAIAEARSALNASLPGISIDRDTHYQLSNRLAFAWRLASLGIPNVLIYLGFTGDDGIRDVGAPFDDDAHWQENFSKHLEAVCPTSPLAAPIDCGPAKFWVLSRSRPVLELSHTKL